MAKNRIKFNKYNSKSTYNNAKNNGEVDDATFSVVRTQNCNENDNNNNTGDVKDLYINDTKLTDVYNSRKTGEDVRTTVTVGGIPAGTSLSELTNMSLGEVLDRILFRTTGPTIKRNPSVSVSYSPVDYLVGTTFPEITQGNISVDGGLYQIEIDGSTHNRGVVSNGFDRIEEVIYTPQDRVVVPDTNKIVVKVKMKSGPTPLDSDCNPYTSETPKIPYQGGIDTKTINLYPYFDWFATGTKVTDESQALNITSRVALTTLPYVRSMGINEVYAMLDVSAGDAEHPQTIKVPGRITEAKISINGVWMNYSLSEVYKAPTTETINNKTYYVYVMKDEAYTDGSVGGSRLKIKVTP